MVDDVRKILESLSMDELERLVAAKVEVDKLEQRRDELQRELTKVERELEKLLGAARGRSVRKKAGRKKAAKKVGRKKVAKKAGRKKVAKKVTRKRAVKKVAKKSATKTVKKAVRKTAKKSAVAARGRGRGRAKGGKTLEDVVYDLIAKRGEPMPFKEIMSTIQKRKLFATRSSNFDNVLRRTLSTSRRVKRVARGVYGI